MKYKWLLFDADGTLFDYDKAEAAQLERTFRQMAGWFEPEYVQVYRQINQQIWQEFEAGRISQAVLRVKRFELLFAALKVEADPAAFSARYLKNLGEGTDLIEGAEETVKALHGQVGLLVITNGLKEVQTARLARSGIGGYFAHVVISEEVGAAKPDKGIFDAAFDKMHGPRKDEVLIVGDGLSSDIRGGHDYGIDTCWFNPGRKPRDLDLPIRYEIARLSDLLTIVDAA
jgi:2-haloacid dehalogenase